MNKFLLYSFVCLIGILVFSACSTTRKIPENSYLLRKNIIQNNNKQIDDNELKKIIKQKSNGFIPFHLLLHNLVDEEKAKHDLLNKQSKIDTKNERREIKGKKTKDKKAKTFRNFLLEIGEKPVILDSSLTKKSVKQLNLYLFKKGFFNSFVEDSTKYHNKKAIVYYIIKSNEPYKLRTISYTITDSLIRQKLEKELPNSLLKSGSNYDESNLIKERERLTKLLNNKGYFSFMKEFITCDIDSALNNHQVDINVEIINPENLSNYKSGLNHPNHKQYYIREIFIVTEYDQFNPNKIFSDTLLYEGYKILYNNSTGYRPNVLVESISIKPNSLYVSQLIDDTYKKLTDLKVFKLVNIYIENDINNNNLSSDSLFLNCYLRLSSSIKQSYGFELEGTTSPSVNIGFGRNLGIEGNLVYSNKNTFKGAEIIELRLKGKLEAQQTFTNEDKTTFFFNTKEIGPELSLHIPKLFLPISTAKLFRKVTPNATRTTFTTSYNFQERPDFKRRIGTVSLSYSGKSKSRNFNMYFPEINLVYVDTVTPLFKELSNKYIISSFIPHITIGPKFIFLYNNQNLKKNRNFIFFKMALEESGMLLRKVYEKTSIETNSDGAFELLKNTPFSEYYKVDFDFRYYEILGNKNRLVYRIAAGAGVPLENSNALPVEKSYFAGGSNNIRAWAARTLGPGSFIDSSKTGTVRIGDINFESNMEFRFNLIKTLNGTIFLDAGNIWLFKKDDNRQNGDFVLNKFHKQIALGTGLGLRLDFSFFVFRFDVGIKLRDPMLIASEEQWVFKHLFDSEWKNNHSKYRFHNFNFGIGYPF